MQSLRSLLVPALLTTWVCTAPCLNAQEPEPTPPAATGSEPPNTSAPEAGQPERRRGNRRGRGRQPQPVIVIEAGTIHPVAGPDIKNGVVVIIGDRISAVGEQGDLGLPADAVVHSFPTGHVYPGLIDAATDAFTDRAIQNDGSLNGGSAIAEGLVWVDERDDQLAAAGITTAYVAARSKAQVRGQGAIVRPQRQGFGFWPDREQAALELRMTDGPTASHPLQRQQQLTSTRQVFDGLDEFRDAKEKFAEELKKYDTDFEAYLDFHKKKNAKEGEAGKEGAGDKKPAEAPSKTEPEQPAPGAGGRRGNRGGGGPPRPEPPKDGAVDQPSPQQVERALATLMAVLAEEAKAPRSQDPRPPGRGERGRGPQDGPQGGPPGASGEGAPAAAAAKKDDGPKRPTYPKQPPKDPQKEALLRVLDGELPLRVEAHRADELRAALQLQREQEIPLLVLEAAYAADEVVEELAQQGATVVLTELLPSSLGNPSARSNPYRSFDPAALPAKLEAAGVPFAIASGRARLAPLLPLMAAAAIGHGLSPEAALRAITLTPAEILGIAKDTGSLARGKYADVIVTDGPLFATDSRILMVVAKGRTEFEVQ